MKMSDYQRLQKILITGKQMLDLVAEEKITPDVLSDSLKAQWLVTTPLYNIGEHAYNVSKELKEQHPDIPWSKVAGLRHRLVHQYDETNWSIIGDIIFNDMPPFLQQIETVCASMSES